MKEEERKERDGREDRERERASHCWIANVGGCVLVLRF